MKSFPRLKKINGGEYFYEITPYYDPKTKKTRHKSKYLGKNIGGSPKRVRQTLPQNIYSYGEFTPLMQIINELRIKENLTQYLGETQANTLLTIALNKVLRPMALHQIKAWYETTYLTKHYGELPLSSQSLSNILAKIGDSSIHLEFPKQLLKEIGSSKTLIYDITSLSSYSKLINLLEYGYSRDNLILPQVNLSLVVDKEKGIPVSYEIYPGSIVDVSTLKNTIIRLKSQGIKDATLVLDRGFFSTANIDELASNRLSYIIPVPMTLKVAKQLLSEIHSRIDDPNLLKMYNKHPLFVMPVILKIGAHSVKGYGIYDQKKEQEERAFFYTQLHKIVEKLRRVRLRRWMNPAEVVEETAKKFTSYVEWKVVDQTFEVSVRKKAVSQRVNKMGKHILLYSGDYTWKDCLTTYKSKDIVEKGFDILKNDINQASNMQKDNTLKGLIFASFLALLIKMRLMKQMQESNLIEDYTLEGLLLELEKTRLIDYGNGKQATTELTRKQQDILNRLKSCA